MSAADILLFCFVFYFHSFNFLATCDKIYWIYLLWFWFFFHSLLVNFSQTPPPPTPIESFYLFFFSDSFTLAVIDDIRSNEKLNEIRDMRRSDFDGELIKKKSNKKTHTKTLLHYLTLYYLYNLKYSNARICTIELKNSNFTQNISLLLILIFIQMTFFYDNKVLVSQTQKLV